MVLLQWAEEVVVAGRPDLGPIVALNRSITNQTTDYSYLTEYDVCNDMVTVGQQQPHECCLV